MTHGRVVMVVDDDVELRECFCEFLQDDGYRVLSASDGADALARLRQDTEKPELILLDLMMPGMNGWEFREAQLRDAELAEIPVVVMTASRNVGDIAVNEVVYKPVKLTRLLEVVDRYTGTRQARQVAATQPGSLASRPVHAGRGGVNEVASGRADTGARMFASDWSKPPVRAGVNEVLAGGGEMGARMRAFDWSKSSVGDVADWPQSLRAAMSICLGSRFPICIYWGRSLAALYNDGWSTIPGTKHPSALGKPAQEVWPEIWDTISGWFDRVIGTGESIYQEGQFLAMHRHGYTEECYFDFTFSPIRGESGAVEGVFNAVVETTFRFVNERRTRVLRDLSEAMAPARTPSDACALAANSLRVALHDVPFCAIYLNEEASPALRLAASSGLPEESPALPRSLVLDDDSSWPLRAAARSKHVEVVPDLVARFGAVFRGGAWPEPTNAAFVAPLLAAGKISGFIVLGANPRRAIDDDYLLFVERAASHVASAIATAMDYEKERRRAEALAEIDRAKTSFFSNVSHEFRTPLTLMLGPTEDLLSGVYGELEQSHREQLEVLRRNGLRLQKLVNALLDFSRLEAGRVQASYESLDLSALTRELASAFETAVERAGLRFAVDCPPLGEPVFVDRDMWEKIVLNLLSNALKFTFEGSIEISLRSIEDRLDLVVKDTGVGISAQDLPRIFERFHRVEGVRARTHEGSGIGLALVQELAKLHGGVAQVESVPGAGTAFTVSIPRGADHLPKDRIGGRHPSATAANASVFVEEVLRWLPGDRKQAEREELPPSRAPETNASAAPVGPGRILLADDNADMRSYIRRHLERWWSVQTVADGAEALRVAQADPPDLILTDVMMPGLGGFELLRELRRDERTSGIPVIMLSARAGEEAKVEGLHAGAEDYLTKPFSARELLARVRTHLELARLRRAVEAERDRYRTMFETAAVSLWEEDFSAVHELVRELKQAHGAGLRAFLAANPAVVDDAVGKARILDVNPATLQMFGATSKDELLDSLHRIFVPESYAVFLDELVAMAEGKPRFVAEAVLRTLAGDPIDVAFVVAFPPAGEGYERVLVTLTDISQGKLAARERDARLAEMERAVRFSEMFVGILGHDLRNPLSAITAAAHLLELRADSEEIKRPVSRILVSADRINRMISQLLDLTRIRLGLSLPLERASVDLAQLSRSISDELEPVYKREIRIEARGDVTGYWDADRLSQLLSNLVGNACQHGLNGTAVLIEVDGTKSHVVHLEIRNRGLIPAEILPVVFEPLRSSERHPKRDGSSGLGLGLYITQQIAFAHGGQIRVESDAEHGTRFTVELPRDADAGASPGFGADHLLGRA